MQLPRPRGVGLLLGLALAVALAACGPRTRRAPATTEPCARLGERCQLLEGPLGVCVEVTELGTCEAPPCLVCQSQH